ncbi:alpha/beta fold hydrolase [Streptomyces lusitanus]|uniref:alpha/beta fold hydrolase n=1 Tax=Streptomyces lusitanus TaxID=68232 RepID=UPI003640E8DC
MVTNGNHSQEPSCPSPPHTNCAASRRTAYISTSPSPGRARGSAAARLPAHLAALERHHGPTGRRYRVIAPDLRGLGASERAVEGYDAGTLAADAEGLLDALGEPSAAVVGIDAGTAPAVLLALRRPDLVRRLVVMEALLAACPEPTTSWRAAPRGGSASTPSPAWPRPSWPATRPGKSTGSSTRGRSGEECPTTSGGLRPRVHRERGPALRVLLLPGPAHQRAADPGRRRDGSADHAHHGRRLPSRRHRARTPTPAHRR